jgi:hypothetical protein
MEVVMRRVYQILSAFAVFAVCLPSGAFAAPQILGLTAFNEAIPLTCADGACTVELTTFCLQRRRDDPEPGTAYTVHDPESVRLILTAADGTRSEVAATGLVSIVTKRGFTAAEARVDASALTRLGAVAAAITVSDGATLIPVPVAGDPDPISAQELAYATGPLRLTAGHWLEGRDAKPSAIRLINRVLNATPPRGRMANNERHGIWDRVNGTESRDAADAGVVRAMDILEACQFRVDVGRYFNLRNCLEVKQDSLMLDMNTRYWSRVDLGS